MTLHIQQVDRRYPEVISEQNSYVACENPSPRNEFRERRFGESSRARQIGPGFVTLT